MMILISYWKDCEPSLRFSVGRSSSPEPLLEPELDPLPLPLPFVGLSAVALRKVGRSLLLSFCTLCRFSMEARRDFT